MGKVLNFAIGAVEIVAGLALAPFSGGLSMALIGLGVTTLAYGAEKLLTSGANKSRPNYQLPPSPVSYQPQAQPLTYRFYSYGKQRLGGNFIFRASPSGTTLLYAHVINCRPIDGIEAYFIDDELLSLSSGPFASISWSSGVQWPNTGMKYGAYIANVYYKGQWIQISVGSGPYCYLEFKNATEAGAVSEILSYYAPALWDSSHLAKGLAVVYSSYQVVDINSRLARYPNGLPVPSNVARTALVYDPRDETQSFLDPSTGLYSIFNPTWKYTPNGALHLADYITFPDGMGLTYDDVNWDSVKQAASDCERSVPVYGGGTGQFAQCHLTWTTEQEPRDVIGKIEAAIDGEMYENEYGKATIWVSQWIEPTVTLTDADLCAPISWDELNGVMAEKNLVIPSYVEPRAKFVRNSSLVVTDAASIAVTGELRGTADYEAVQDFNQAFRNTTRALRRKNTPLRLTCGGGPRMLLADGQRVVRITSRLLGIDGVFRVISLGARDLANISGTFHLLTRDMFEDVVPPFDPLNPTLPGTLAAAYTPQTPNAPTLSSASADGGAQITAQVAAPTSPPDPTARAVFRSRAVDPSTHAPLGSGDWTIWVDYLGQYEAASPLITGVAGTPQAFEVDAWFISINGQPSAFSSSSFITLTSF